MHKMFNVFYDQIQSEINRSGKQETEVPKLEILRKKCNWIVRLRKQK